MLRMASVEEDSSSQDGGGSCKSLLLVLEYSGREEPIWKPGEENGQ